MIFSKGRVCEYFEFNPKETLKKNQEYKKISMENIVPKYKFINKYCLEKYKGGSKFKNGDTIFARITPCLENGKIAYIDCLEDDEIAFGSTEYIVLRAIENKMIPEFVYYFAISDYFKNKSISLMTGTSGRQRVQTDALKALNVKIPDIISQKKIVKILSIIDKKIKLNNEINNNLHELIIQQYSKYLEDLESYEELVVKDIFDFETGVEPGSKNYLNDNEEGSIKFYRVGDMNSDCSTFIKKELSNGKLLSENDIVVSFDATIGRIGFGLNGSYSTGMKKISLKDKYKNIADNSIIYAYFNHKEIQNIMMENARGTTILHASSSIDFMKFKYNESLLKEYSKMISLSFGKMKNIKKENEKLSQLRDTLLPKLMNGEIDLDNIEI